MNILKQAIGEINDGIKSLAGFDCKHNLVQKLLKETNELSFEKKKDIQLIVYANKKIAIALNMTKNVVSDVQVVRITLSEVINSNAGSNHKKIHLAISAFEKSMGVLLPKLDNARDGLSNVTPELKSIAFSIRNLLTSCSNKTKQLKNEKEESAIKKRRDAYGGATNTAIVATGAAATIAAILNPVATILASIVAAGATGFPTAVVAFPIAAGYTETAMVPRTKKKYDERIKRMTGFLNKLKKFQMKMKKKPKS